MQNFDPAVHYDRNTAGNQRIEMSIHTRVLPSASDLMDDGNVKQPDTDIGATESVATRE